MLSGFMLLLGGQTGESSAWTEWLHTSKTAEVKVLSKHVDLSYRNHADLKKVEKHAEFGNNFENCTEFIFELVKLKLEQNECNSRSHWHVNMVY